MVCTNYTHDLWCSASEPVRSNRTFLMQQDQKQFYNSTRCLNVGVAVPDLDDQVCSRATRMLSV